MATTDAGGQLMGLTSPHLLDKATENDEVILTDEETNYH